MGVGDSFSIEAIITLDPGENASVVNLRWLLTDSSPIAALSVLSVTGVIAPPQSGAGTGGAWQLPAAAVSAFVPECVFPDCSPPVPAVPSRWTSGGNNNNPFPPPTNTGTFGVGSITVLALAPGTLTLTVDTGFSFWRGNDFIPHFDFSGSNEFHVTEAPEAPLALLLGPVLFGVAFLRRSPQKI